MQDGRMLTRSTYARSVVLYLTPIRTTVLDMMCTKQYALQMMVLREKRRGAMGSWLGETTWVPLYAVDA